MNLFDQSEWLNWQVTVYGLVMFVLGIYWGRSILRKKK